MATSIQGAARAPQPRAVPALQARVESLDLLRGGVMVLMALDHARDYFFVGRFDPLDLSRTTPALFATRWITHFCAPVFVFLAGAGAFLSASRGRSRGELSRFLLTRGLWLIALEMTWINFGWSFVFDFGIVLQVIWAIGCSMIVLSLLIFLPARAVGLIGLAMIAGHNLLDRVQAASLGSLGWVWSVLHEPDRLQPPGGPPIFTAYPLVPWIGVMAAGYAFGELVLLPQHRRRRTFLALGGGLLAAFLFLRATNLYGDPNPWSSQSSTLLTVFSFVKCEKYPPSLLFLLMTLGPAILALGLLEQVRGGRWKEFLLTYGRVPLFFYVLHVPLIHAAAVVLGAAQGFAPARLLGNPFVPGFPEGYGLGLGGVYLVWVVIVLVLFFPCRRFGALKARRRDWWLRYL